MKWIDTLQILSQLINFTIFLYFAIILIQTSPLDIINIIISSIGLFASLLVNILDVIEKLKERGE